MARSGGIARVKGVPPMKKLTRIRIGISATATWRALLRTTLTASSALPRQASWMPTACSTALPAMATMTRPAKTWLMPRTSIAGSSASTNHSETKAAPSPAPQRTTMAVVSGQASSRLWASAGMVRSPCGEHRADRDGVDDEEHDGADHGQRLLVLAGGQVELVGEGREDERGDGEHEERGDHPRRLAAEAQGAVAPAAGDEGEAEDEEGVREDRADQRGLDDGDEPGLEREDADEELGEVADRGLDDAGRGGAEVVAELVGRLADEVGDAGEGERRRRRRWRRRGAAAKWSAPATTTMATEIAMTRMSPRPSPATMRSPPLPAPVVPFRGGGRNPAVRRR